MSIQSLGGKARAAAMTPEERSAAAAHAAKRGAKKLGKEGRAARSAKGWETRRKAAEKAELAAVDAEIEALCHVPLVQTPPKVPGLFDPAKPKRALPKPGTMNARVLEVLRGKVRVLAEEIADSLVPAASVSRVSNALSSLRTAGHVISEPGSGGKEKRWTAL